MFSKSKIYSKRKSLLLEQSVGKVDKLSTALSAWKPSSKKIAIDKSVHNKFLFNCKQNYMAAESYGKVHRHYDY